MPLDHTPVVYSLLLCALFVQGVFATRVAEFAALEFLLVLPRKIAMGVIVVPLAVVTLEADEVILRHGGSLAGFSEKSISPSPKLGKLIFPDPLLNAFLPFVDTGGVWVGQPAAFGFNPLTLLAGIAGLEGPFGV